MSSNASDSNKQLEKQMQNMCIYLEQLVACDEGDHNDKDLGICENNALGTGSSCNGGPRHAIIHTENSMPISPVNPSNFSQFNYALVGASPQYPLNMVTSALANATNLNSYAPKFIPNTHFYSKMRRLPHKQCEKDIDTSGIDIDATMAELGLTPELFTQNDVHKLFSLFSNLDFSIHAEYITSSIYDQKNIPNTMNVSSQTKYAIWSCYKLHRDLREVLKRPMPAEYKPAFLKCEEALAELQHAISALENFKHCSLEHRKGIFVTREAEDHLQPLMVALNHLTACVEKSRMYIQVYERALNAPERYKPTLQAPREEHPQPIPEVSSADVPSTSRPLLARRYIG